VAMIPTLLGAVGDLAVYGGIPEDFFDSWACLEDCHSSFFADDSGIHDRASFEKFCRRKVLDVAVSREASGRIVCAGYIIPEARYAACFHGYCAPKYRSPDISIPCARLGLRYFFRRYGFERISVLGRWGNRVARLYAMRQGFTIEGRLRSYLRHKGQFVDAYFGSMLKGEV